MIYVAKALADNIDFSVIANQYIAAIELNEELFIDPKTQKFSQEMFDIYFHNAILLDPNGAIADIVGCKWEKVDDIPEIIHPIVSVKEDDQ